MLMPDPNADIPPGPHAVHLQDGDATGFDDSQQPVPIAWPHDDGEALPEIDLLNRLLTASNRVQALEMISEAFVAIGDKRAADTLRLVFLRLQRGGKRGRELRAALLAGCGMPVAYADEAEAANVPRQVFWRSIQALRQRVFEKSDDSSPIGEGQ